jgi:hypothetical protein
METALEEDIDNSGFDLANDLVEAQYMTAAIEDSRVIVRDTLLAVGSCKLD